MTAQELARQVSELSSEQRAAVEKFIAYLKGGKSSPVNARAAIDSFMNEHAELMRLLAQ